MWGLIATAWSWLHFSGRRGNTVNCELKLHIMLLEMRTSKGGLAMHAISRKTSWQMRICAGIVEIGIMLCRGEEELTDSRDLQSILMFHNCASVCRTATEVLKSLNWKKKQNKERSINNFTHSFTTSQRAEEECVMTAHTSDKILIKTVFNRKILLW